MKRNRLALLPAALLLPALQISPLLAAGGPSVTPPQATEIESLLASFAEEGFSGGIAVRRGDAEIHSAEVGFSDRKRTVPVDGDTLFMVASISKYFTAAAILKAAEDGLLSLDDPLSRFLPDFPADKGKLTIRSLLAHDSGMPMAYATDGVVEQEMALRKLSKLPLDLERQGSFRYSNDGYALLAILVEIVHGRPYEVIVREDLLAPARMDRTRFWGETDVSDAAVVAQVIRSFPRRFRRRNYGLLGSSGLLTTASDLVRWQAAVMGGQVLSAASLAELTAKRHDVSIGFSGYGVFLDEDPSYGRRLMARGSEDVGYNAALYHYLDRDLIIAVVTSTGPDQGDLYRNRVEAALAKILLAPR